MRALGHHFGYAPIGNPQKTELPTLERSKSRVSMMYTMGKDVASE